MKNFYFLKLGFLLFTLAFSSDLISQCSVSAPADGTINCGNSYNLVAPTNVPTYSYVYGSCAPVAITGTNAFPTACDDCITGDINIGFPFNFYGNVYNQLRIQSNGIVGFGGMTYTGYSGFTIPAAGDPNNYIAGLYADIDIRCGGTITYQLTGTAPNRRFVVFFNNVAPYGGGSPGCTGTGRASFQIILNENGSFQTIITHLSANWASSWGSEITQGVENNNGTYAVATTGRNDQVVGGIGPGAQDCYTFNPGVCVFQRWELNGTTISTNTSHTVSPSVTTTYTGVWDCAGYTCTDDLVVNVNGPTMVISGLNNNTNCLTANGSFNLMMNNFQNGTYTLNYLLNGTPQTRSVTITSASQAVSFTGLNASSYTNFSVSAGCNSSFTTGPATITNNFVTPILSVGSIVNATSCTVPNGSLVLTGTGLSAGTHTVNYSANGSPASTTLTSTGSTNVNQNTVFNSGTLSAASPIFNRPSTYDCPNSWGNAVYYHSQAFIPSTTGSYTFNNVFDADGYGLIYSNSFTASSPCVNFLLANDDSNGGADPRLTITLTAGVTYYLVTTTFSNGVTGNFSWQYTGPAGATIAISSTAATSTITGLAPGVYTNFTVGTGCNQFTLAGPFTITGPNSPTTTGASLCIGGSGTLGVSSVCSAGAPQTQSASGSGGTSNQTTYGGAGNTNITVAFPALPVGAVVTGTSTTINFATNGGSYRSELRVRITPPASVGALQSDIQPSTLTSSGSVTAAPMGAWGTGNPVGNWLFEFRETLNDGGATIDANITNVTVTATYTLPSTLQWYTASTGGSSISSANPFNPVGVAGSGLANTNTAGSTVYYAACSANPTCRTATTFLINPQSTAPTSISGAGAICVGNTVTLTVVGGSLASGSNWEWFTGSCGGTPVGTGTSITVTPTATTTYYVRGSGIGSCPATACASATVTLPTQGTTLGQNGESATCVVNDNNYIHFYHSSGRLLLSINSMGQNLGNVTVTAYTGTPVDVNGCGALSGFVITALGRRWLVTPQFQPTVPINVALHFDLAEYTALVPVANGNSNPNDNLSSIADLKLSKYSGPLNQDNLASNNCVENGGNGGTTIHAQVSNTTTSTMFPGFAASGRTTIHSIPGFSELWLHGSNLNVPLPVTLSSFNGICEENKVSLNWETQSEVNSKKFIVEKLRDGEVWVNVGEVESVGNSTSSKVYSFVDVNGNSGDNIYRINQIDTDGKSTIFNSLNVNCLSEVNSFKIYPNPNDGDFILEVQSNQNIKEAYLEIYDVSGKKLLTNSISILSGSTLFPINVVDLSTGSYIIKIQASNFDFKPVMLIKK